MHGLVSGLLALLLLPTARVEADDLLRLRAGGNDQGFVEVTGTITDYTGRQVMVARGGREQGYPADRVIEITTNWPPGYDEGKQTLAEGDYPAAIEHFTRAAQGDPRVWVRRLVMQQMMQAYAAQGDWLRAGDLLVSIAASDPTTAALTRAPLAWHTVEGVPHARAQQWLRDTGPVAQLLGASHALPGPLRGEATTVLEGLARSEDPRIAMLAQAQLWRTKLVTAGLSEVTQWEKQLSQSATPVGGGPWLVVGDAYAHRGEHDRAALAWLHAPIDFPDDISSAARGLLMAAQATAAAGHPGEQQKLLRELTSRYPRTPPAQQGATMLQSAPKPGADGSGEGTGAVSSSRNRQG